MKGVYSVKRSSRRQALKKKKNRVRKKKTGLILVSLVTVLCLGILSVFFIRKLNADKETGTESLPESTESAETETKPVNPEIEKKKALKELKEKVRKVEPDFQFAEFSVEPTFHPTGDPLLDQAERLALGYDYDGAIALLTSETGYGGKKEFSNAIAKYRAKKNSLLEFEIKNNITHIFFHSLIVNPAITFDKTVTGYKLRDYNEAMTTVSEFVAMIEEMYSKGYVLVDLYDVAGIEKMPDGTEKMVYRKIELPEGKKPFLLSIDDTNYYEYMTGQGFATRLLLTEDGEVKNEYRLTDGTTVIGSFDVIPILEDFLETNPDFSYHGARGIAGITGYNGVLGYRTSDFWYDPDCDYYEATEANEKYRKEEIPSGYNENIAEDKKTAKKTADGIKALGWHFASHTWGHKRLGEVAVSTMVWDSDLWEKEVASIIGDTDILIFPYGNDFGQTVGWKEYEYEGPNERYRTMYSYGFRYFLNVDSSVYFMQRTDQYFRQGRRNLDGERIFEALLADSGDEKRKNRLGDLFTDVSKIIDPLRPALD